MTKFPPSLLFVCLPLDVLLVLSQVETTTGWLSHAVHRLAV
ncbi:hypothetical protein [uncultured Hymenobacter sp.]